MVNSVSGLVHTGAAAVMPPTLVSSLLATSVAPAPAIEMPVAVHSMTVVAAALAPVL